MSGSFWILKGRSNIWSWVIVSPLDLVYQFAKVSIQPASFYNIISQPESCTDIWLSNSRLRESTCPVSRANSQELGLEPSSFHCNSLSLLLDILPDLDSRILIMMAHFNYNNRNWKKHFFQWMNPRSYNKIKNVRKKLNLKIGEHINWRFSEFPQNF